jgi:hypothetical protein
MIRYIARQLTSSSICIQGTEKEDFIFKDDCPTIDVVIKPLY